MKFYHRISSVSSVAQLGFILGSLFHEPSPKIQVLIPKSAKDLNKVSLLLQDLGKQILTNHVPFN